MPNVAPANRARLAEYMEARRRELGLRWQDVATAGGVSVRALQLARDTGRDGDVSLRTLEGIDRGLRLEPGSARQLLDVGRDPVPLTSAPLPATPAGEPRAAGLARGLGADPDDPADPFLRSVREDIAAAVIAHGAGAAGSQVFHGQPASDIEARTWDDPRLSQEDKELAIAGMRAARARYEASRSGGSRGAAGLAQPASGGP